MVLANSLIGLPQALANETPKRILFYDPDANHHAIIQITKWFNLYLTSGTTGYTFQPVQTVADFENQLKNNDVSFVIVSSLYLKENQKKLEPLLVPAKDTDVYYRKVLVAKEGMTAESLNGKHIAAAISSGNRQAAIKALTTQLKNSSAGVTPGMVVPVAKDIDALFALTFGHVQGALVTPSSIEALKRVSPGAAAGVKAIYESAPILRAPLAAVSSRANSKDKKLLIAALKTMTQDENGRRVMHMLAFDNWRAYKQAMLKKGGAQ